MTLLTPVPASLVSMVVHVRRSDHQMDSSANVLRGGRVLAVKKVAIMELFHIKTLFCGRQH